MILKKIFYLKISEPEKEEESLNERKRHPSFETWIKGSPHSSEEFDTDVEEDVVECK